MFVYAFREDSKGMNTRALECEKKTIKDIETNVTYKRRMVGYFNRSLISTYIYHGIPESEVWQNFVL